MRSKKASTFISYTQSLSIVRGFRVCSEREYETHDMLRRQGCRRHIVELLCDVLRLGNRFLKRQVCCQQVVGSLFEEHKVGAAYEVSLRCSPGIPEGLELADLDEIVG